MQYDVLEPGLVLVPSYQFFNRQGTCLFVSSNPKLSSRPSAVGRYTSTCWIPGNFLAEGSVLVSAVIGSVAPPVVHAFAHQAVAFEVTISLGDDVLRAGYDGPYPGMVRPLLDWTTDVSTLPANAALLA
jgi:lipopolysaccharide transport system ATP-binding protein